MTHPLTHGLMAALPDCVIQEVPDHWNEPIENGLGSRFTWFIRHPEKSTYVCTIFIDPDMDDHVRSLVVQDMAQQIRLALE